ncbi:hypothetical protein VVR12_08080 [Rothia sp. LK2588]|uniref:hypothetical protein n=1 Tax=Rothia sp. LK2588 TaxID=3114369 RepID=UPI0034CE0B33
MEDNSVPAYLTEGYRSPLGPYQREVEESSRGAHRIIDHIFGDKKSYLDPEYTIWDAETARRAQEVILNTSWKGTGDPFLEIPKYIVQAPVENRPLALFFGETYLLRNMQSDRLTINLTMGCIEKILMASYDPDRVAQMIRETETRWLLGLKIFKGGQQFGDYPSMHFIWMAQVCVTLSTLTEPQKVIQDPWALKSHLERASSVTQKIYQKKYEEIGEYKPHTPPQGGLDRAFRIATFPNVFEPLYLLGVRRDVTNYFQRKLNLPDTGDDDRNLLEIPK